METKNYKNSAKFHLRPARMYIHVVLFIFLICMLVLALDQSQADAVPAENQGDLQVVHPGERRTILYGLRKGKREQQKLNFSALISTASSENNNVDVKAGCSSFDAGSSENLLNKNYIKLNNSDKLEEITVLNYACSNDWNKLPPGSNKHIKPYGNKIPLANLLNDMNGFNDLTPLNENNISLDNNFNNIPEKNEENKFIEVLLKGSSDLDANINGLLPGSSKILFEKKNDGNNFDIGNSDSVDTSNDGRTKKGLHKAAMKSSENDLDNEEKVIETQILSKHNSNIIENLTNDVKKNAIFHQKLLDYYNGQYKSYNKEWVKNKGILSHTENIHNVLQLPEAKFKNVFSSNYYTGGGFFSKNHYDPINKRLYVLPVIIPESYLTNLMLINPSRGKCLLKSLENNGAKNFGSMQWGHQRYITKSSSQPKSTAMKINYSKKTSGSSKSVLVKNTSPLGERSHKETKKFKNTTNFDTTVPLSMRTVTKNDTELTVNLLPTKRLQNVIQNISLLEIATKISTEYVLQNIDNNKKTEKNNLAVTPVSNTTNINNETINADFIKMMNEVLKLLNESKDQNINDLKNNQNNNNSVYLTTESKSSLKSGEQNYQTPSSQNMVEINDNIQVKNSKSYNLKNNPSLLIEEIEEHVNDKINDLTKNDQHYNTSDDILPSILQDETPNVESLIFKYENVTTPKRSVINSENTEGGDVKLIRSLDSKKYRNNDKTNNNYDTSHQINECEHKSNDEVSNGTKIDSLDKRPDNAVCTVEYKNQPVVNYLNLALQKRSCNGTTNDNNAKIIIIDSNLHHKPIKFEYFNKILKDICHNHNSNCESLSKNDNVSFKTSSNNILMKKLSPTISSLGKICVRGPENLSPRKVDIIFPGLLKTVLNEIQPRDVHFLLQNDPETSGRETQDKSCLNRNELTTAKPIKQQNILEQLKRMNETLMKLREDINKGLFDGHNSTINI